MPNSNQETEPLNPPPSYNESDHPSPPYETPSTEPREPLYLFILYGLSFAISIIGLSCAFWGWYMARTAPFDKWSKQNEIDSYERNFLGMMSIYSLLSGNILWTGMNLYFLRKGNRNHSDISDLNSGYDFLIWAALIAFGVLNMVVALWDRRLCDGWGREQEMYERCDDAQFKLLVVELVAVNLGLVVAVVHFILLIARCCGQGQRNDEARSGWLRLRIREEEDVLRNLMERRRLLEGEAQPDAESPSLPGEEVVVEDLIDVGEARPHIAT